MKRKRSLLDLLDMDLKSPVANECMPWVVIYLVAACLVFSIGSQIWGILLFANAALALVIGLITRGMGKQDAPAVLLGLLLGPLGALAGMIAARPAQK
jgi:hypothetical protein